MYREEGEPGIAFCHFPITTVCHLCKASLFLVLIHVSLLIGSKKRLLQQNLLLGLTVLGKAGWEGAFQQT